MQIVEVRFRVTEGEEMSQERIETLEDLGIDESQLVFVEEGEVMIRLSFNEETGESEIATEVEELSERASDATGDMDLIDFEFGEDA